MVRRCRWAAFLLCLLGGGAGCLQVRLDPADRHRLESRAMDTLKRGVTYEHLPTVRAQAIEVLQEVPKERALPWIRHALQDEHPAVRFAACVALGTRRDRVAQPAIRKLLQSVEASDRVAAIFALHRLGERRHTAELATYLLESDQRATRNHAAFVLGRMGETGAVKLLARAMNDSDPGLRANVLESMLLLGAPEARSTLYGNAYSGLGVEETFAISALAMLRDQEYVNLFRQKLSSALHIETRLAAARALGMLGLDDGFALAAQSLKYRAREDTKNDPASNKTLRVRQLAVLALGAIGKARAVPRLEVMMNEADDPRLQIAAAKAILEILRTDARVPRQS